METTIKIHLETTQFLLVLHPQTAIKHA